MKCALCEAKIKWGEKREVVSFPKAVRVQNNISVLKGVVCEKCKADVERVEK